MVDKHPKLNPYSRPAKKGQGEQVVVNQKKKKEKIRITVAKTRYKKVF
jgi:hypothetical protein